MQDESLVNSSDLVHQVVEAASVIQSIIDKEAKMHSKTPKPAGFDMVTSLDAAQRLVKLVLLALQRSSVPDTNPTLEGNAVFALASLFSHILALIETTATDQAKQFSVTASEATVVRRSSRPGTKKKRRNDDSSKPADTLSILTSFSCNMIDALDSTSQVHRALLEAISFSVLEKVGRRLYASVFGHARAATLDAEISRGLTTSGDDKDAAEIRACAILAPCLIQLLRRIMTAWPHHLDSDAGEGTDKPKRVDHSGPGEGVLTLAARERLQKTLVDCIFGREGIDGNDLVRECVRKPAAKITPLHAPKTSDADTADWFQGEVWGLLGWQILTQ